MATDAARDRPLRKSFPSRRGTEFGTLTQVFEDVFWAWGTTRFLPGAAFPRNMTVLREKGGLVVVHPVLLPDAEQKRVEALGPIEHIIRLGDFHGMDDALYQQRYGAKLWAPRGAHEREGARVDAELAPGGDTPLSDGTLHGFEVAVAPELVLHLERHEGMLLTCDSVQNWERVPDGCSLLGAVMARTMGFRGRACIGPGWRRACEPKQEPGFGPRFRAILELPFRHALSAHGPPMLDTAKEDLRASVERLYPA
jgi:hypothetical protein